MHEGSGKVTEQNDEKNNGHKNLAVLILIGMVSGLFLGLVVYYSQKGLFGEWGIGIGEYCQLFVNIITPLGTAFIKLLKMIIIPVVFSSIFMAMVHLGTPEKLGSIGKVALGYYFLTTAMAVLMGLLCVNIIQPGVGADLGQAGLTSDLAQKIEGNTGLFQTIGKVLLDAIPSNPVEAMANSEILQVIIFTILFGIVALHMREKAAPLVKSIESLEALSLELTGWIMKLAPLGIFVLVAGVIAESGLDAIFFLFKYVATVLIGLSLHAIILLMLAAARLKRSPFYFLKQIYPALLTAFSTASSAATLPVTLAIMENKVGVKKDTAKFVLPLGATINMVGTALYESVAAIFIAEAYNIPLGFGEQVIIFLTASLAAVGAAAIPSAGLVTMSIVLTAVGLPLEGIGLIIAVDRILDMFRTAINVLGDCVGTVVVDSFAEETFLAPNTRPVESSINS